MFETITKEQAVQVILDSVKAYYKAFMQKPSYKEGDRIPYASRVLMVMEYVHKTVKFGHNMNNISKKYQILDMTCI